MGVLKAALQGQRAVKELVRLAPNQSARTIRAYTDRCAEWARALPGVTGGDLIVLSTAMLRAIDASSGDYKEAAHCVTRDVRSGELRSVSGKPIRDVVHVDAASRVIEFAVATFRPAYYEADLKRYDDQAVPHEPD